MVNKKDKFDLYYALSLVGQVGYTVAIPLVVLAVAGVFLDNKFNTKPVMTLGGLLLGMISSFYALYRLLKPFLTFKKKK
jgi:ATP synthase protein I